LLKTLYGLKQGAKNWYNTLYRALIELGFKRTEANHGVFFKEIGGDIVILAVHVDDCMVTGSSTKLISEFKAEVNKNTRLQTLDQPTGFWVSKSLTILPTRPFPYPNMPILNQ